MRRLLYLLPVALFAVLIAYFALTLRPGRDPSALPSALIDKPAPDFDLAGLAGAQGLSRAALGGHPAIVNFFASWCVPCRAEHPLLMRLAEQEHVPLFGIAYKDKPAASASISASTACPRPTSSTAPATSATAMSDRSTATASSASCCRASRRSADETPRNPRLFAAAGMRRYGERGRAARAPCRPRARGARAGAVEAAALPRLPERIDR